MDDTRFKIYLKEYLIALGCPPKRLKSQVEACLYEQIRVDNILGWTKLLPKFPVISFEFCVTTNGNPDNFSGQFCATIEHGIRNVNGWPEASTEYFWSYEEAGIFYIEVFQHRTSSLYDIGSVSVGDFLLHLKGNRLFVEFNYQDTPPFLECIKQIHKAIEAHWGNILWVNNKRPEFLLQQQEGEETPQEKPVWEMVPDHNEDREIVKMYCEGYMNSEIGGRVSLAPRSVTNIISALRGQGFPIPFDNERRKARKKLMISRDIL